MTQREAHRLAHGLCAGLLQNFLDVGGPEKWTDTEADAERLHKAVDALAQREFELGRGVNAIAPGGGHDR